MALDDFLNVLKTVTVEVVNTVKDAADGVTEEVKARMKCNELGHVLKLEEEDGSPTLVSCERCPATRELSRKHY